MTNLKDREFPQRVTGRMVQTSSARMAVVTVAPFSAPVTCAWGAVLSRCLSTDAAVAESFIQLNSRQSLGWELFLNLCVNKANRLEVGMAGLTIRRGKAGTFSHVTWTSVASVSEGSLKTVGVILWPRLPNKDWRLPRRPRDALLLV